MKRPIISQQERYILTHTHTLYSELISLRIAWLKFLRALGIRQIVISILDRVR